MWSRSYVASRVLEFLNPELKRTSLSAIVGDIRASMMEEVDFLKEARNIAQFQVSPFRWLQQGADEREHTTKTRGCVGVWVCGRGQDYLERMGLEDVATCPFVYKELSSRRVLTLEKFDGVPLTDLEAIRSVSPGGNAEATLIAALNTWCVSSTPSRALSLVPLPPGDGSALRAFRLQLLQYVRHLRLSFSLSLSLSWMTLRAWCVAGCRFGSVMMCDSFHADVHAGNLLVLRDGRVAFIDFGIVGRISPLTWNAMQVTRAASPLPAGAATGSATHAQCELSFGGNIKRSA